MPMMTLPPLAPKSVSSREKNLLRTSLFAQVGQKFSPLAGSRCWCHDCFYATDSCQSDWPNLDEILSLSDDMLIKTSHIYNMRGLGSASFSPFIMLNMQWPQSLKGIGFQG